MIRIHAIAGAAMLLIINIHCIENNETEFLDKEVSQLLNQYFMEVSKERGKTDEYNPDKVDKLLEIPLTRSITGETEKEELTEETANRKSHIIARLFQNDIVLSKGQVKHLLEKVRAKLGAKSNFTTEQRVRRQAQQGQTYIWEFPISYSFASNDPTWQNRIRKAIKYIESETCVRFQENGGNADQLRYIVGGGCYSSVGRVGGRQDVSIGKGCESVSIVAHETLHALGLWHEQSRDDRDSSVWIDYGSIAQGTEGNFAKMDDTDNYHQSYDVGSVMHYGPKAFTTDLAKDTIVTRDPDYQHTIGQRNGISFKDGHMLNLRYCADKCPTQLWCDHGGYTDPNDCSRCKCPSGYGGTNCQQLEISDPNTCGGELVANGTMQEFKSPPFISNMRCVWRIKAPQSQKMYLSINNMVMPCQFTCSTFIEIKRRLDKTETGPRFCCELPTHAFWSDDSEVIVIGKVGDLNYPESYRFSFLYQAFS